VVFESLCGGFTRDAGQVLDDADGAVPQLRIGGMDIDHQVFDDLAELHHGQGGEDIEQEFGGGACFQAGGPG